MGRAFLAVARAGAGARVGAGVRARVLGRDEAAQGDGAEEGDGADGDVHCALVKEDYESVKYSTDSFLCVELSVLEKKYE